MQVVRRGTFETNSSSTHSITMCSEDEYNKWKNGELLYDYWHEEFITKKEYEEKIKKEKEEYFKKYPNETEEDFEEYIEDDKQFFNYQDFWDYIDYETFEDSYTTSKGEKVIAFGYYGNDY